MILKILWICYFLPLIIISAILLITHMIEKKKVSVLEHELEQADIRIKNYLNMIEKLQNKINRRKV